MQNLSLQRDETVELPERKRVCVSVMHGHIDILIAHEIRPGSVGHLLNAAADAQCSVQDGPVTGECGGVLAILPRMLDGLTFWIDRERQHIRFREIDVKPGTIGACGAGIIALGRFRLSFPWSPLELREISVSSQGLDIPVEVDFETEHGICVLESSVPMKVNGCHEAISMGDEERHWIRVHGCTCDQEK